MLPDRSLGSLSSHAEASRSSPGRLRVPAIVLTCDRYHTFASHMIARYDSVWPSHPFTFHVPFQRQAIEGPRIVSRRTPEAIRTTVLTLLEEFDDETWVYWCIDDRYPIALVQPQVARLVESVLSDSLPDVDGVLFCRIGRLLQSKHLLEEERDGPGGVVLRRRKDYSQIWMHQAVRVKVLRRLFELFPEAIPMAKTMDGLKDRIALPTNQRLYVVETNLAVFGESTTRGHVTRNCATSLRALNLDIPAGFEESDREMLMGAIDSSVTRSAAECGPNQSARQQGPVKQR